MAIHSPVIVVKPYTEKEAFLQDPPLANNMSIPSNKVCKSWINKNECKQGTQCLFRHPTGKEFSRIQAEWVEEVKAR